MLWEPQEKKRYQFWRIRYYFTRPDPYGRTYEDKPMMLLHSNPDGSWMVAYATSRFPKNYDPAYDVVINRWDLCGLTRKTYVRCNRHINIPQSQFIEYVGTPTIGDLINIKTVLGVPTY